MSTQVNKEDLSIFISDRENTCSSCGEKLDYGAFVALNSSRDIVLCLTCADLDHLVYLPAGDTALTRRSQKYSRLSAVVWAFSRSRKRSERQGILVESEALERAEQECEADADQREKRRAQAAIRRAELDEKYVKHFAECVRELYPFCPEGRETTIAEHACRKYSGRVGRSAAAKELAEPAIDLAVIAHIRHAETNYDYMLSNYWDRRDARESVRDYVDQVLNEWKNGPA